MPSRSRSLTMFLSAFDILSGCISIGFKCLIWHQIKHFIVLVLTLIKPFTEFLNLQGNLMYVLPDNGLKTEILINSASIDSITQPDPSLIKFSVLCKISWKDLSRIYFELINVLVELK